MPQDAEAEASDNCVLYWLSTRLDIQTVNLATASLPTHTCFTILLLFDCKIFSVISGGFVQVRCIASQMVRDEVVRIKEDGVAVMVNKCTWLLLEKIITRYNSRLMSLSKTKATRRSPCYGEERLFLAFLGCWLGRLFRRSLLLVGTLVELGCNHDDSGVLHAILVCPLLWLEETLDGEQRALGELVE